MDRPRERARRGRSVADQAWLPCIEGLLQSRLLAASKIRVLVDLLGTDHSAPVDLSPPLRGGEVTNLGYDALRVHPCPDPSPALGSERGCSHHPDPPLSGSESSGSSPSAAKMRARPLSLGLCPGSVRPSGKATDRFGCSRPHLNHQDHLVAQREDSRRGRSSPCSPPHWSVLHWERDSPRLSRCDHLRYSPCESRLYSRRHLRRLPSCAVLGRWLVAGHSSGVLPRSDRTVVVRWRSERGRSLAWDGGRQPRPA